MTRTTHARARHATYAAALVIKIPLDQPQSPFPATEMEWQFSMQMFWKRLVEIYESHGYTVTEGRAHLGPVRLTPEQVKRFGLGPRS